MSAEATKALRTLPDEVWGQIEAVRRAVPEHRRPSSARVQLVLREIAWCFIDDLGYADPTVAQIAAALKDVSVSTVTECLKVLRDAELVPILRRSTRGEKGRPGRAPRRGLSFYVPTPTKKLRKSNAKASFPSVAGASKDELRQCVDELHALSRDAPTPMERQQALLKWQYLREQLRRLENV
jgi:DNA-binding transcriptional ArsR family regulator